MINIQTLEFIPIKNLTNSKIKEINCCRNHIDISLNEDDLETPDFDKLIKYQLSNDEIYNYFLFSIGRLFYQVKEHDNYQVMPMIIGEADSGKSTSLNVIKKMFKSVATINSTQEKTFGLQDKYDKELLIAPDIPSKISNYLEQTLFQSMVSGEGVSIPRKNKGVLDVDWTVPMIWTANHYPDYKDNLGSISRRIMVFEFENTVKNRDTQLEHRIINNELGKIIVKSLVTYREIVKENKTKGFWDFCPQYFKDKRDEVRMKSNYLYKFLTMAPDDNMTQNYKYCVEYKKGHIENLSEIRRVFKNFMKFKYPKVRYKWDSDRGAFKQLGYEVKRINQCASCGKEATKGCCDNYNANNRRRKYIIVNLKLKK